ncbi:MAG TPA: AAA domain-containing protein, partial [Myxococcota bacterium]|nr:AAA domain-containing protein [Myxococcota bacterium]
HCYPYVRDPGTQKVHLLRWDQERNRRYQIGDALRNLYFQDAQLRPPLGRFFAGLDSEQTVKLQLFADKKDWPDFQDRQEVFLEAVVGDDSVEVRLPREVWDIPERGWIRPAEDQGNAMQLRRQKEATQSLRRSGSLMSQLHHPQAVRGFRQPWAQAGRHLRGKGAEIVRDMLCSEPFFALHGPPGTGKTTVAAEAVATTLRADPTRRILISSQSHYALDNLAQRVLGRCRKGGIDVVAIRIASDYAVERGKIPLQMERYLPEKLAESKVNSLLRDLPEWQRNGELRDGMRLTPLLKALLGRWQEQVKRVEGEIRDRLRRGANLVFATTGACTPEKLSNGTLFDWVIVEEAARAWPTELAMPLILGRRWTLIGDHFQLPAFDEQRVEKVLQLCKEQGKDEDLLAHGEQRQTYMQSFRLFGNLFDQRAERRRNRPSGSRLVEPLDELDLQFRMHPDIAAVVARAFYRKWINPDTGELVDYPGGWLQSDTETEKNLHNFQRPPFLRGRALLWLNTDGMPDSDD